MSTDDADGRVIHLTQGLVTVLLELASDADPRPVTIQLAVESADELGIDELDGDVPVFASFYLPDAGRSVEAVFGMNVAVPPGQTPGVFVSHPTGPLDVRTEDEHAERVVVAVPPWTDDQVAAFTRGGRRCRIVTHEVAPRDRADFV